MTRPHRFASWILAVFAAACATVDNAPDEIYENIGQAMEAEIEPFAEDLLPAQLTKDPEDVDYRAVEARARSVAGIFEQMQDTSRKLYEPDGVTRGHAKTAATYFSALATAAAAKNHQTLVQLAVRKSRICAHCHD